MILKKLHIVIFLISLSVSLFAQSRRHLSSDTCTFSTYPQKAEAILTQLEDNGYPFASVRLESANPEQGDLTMRIKVDSNIFVTFDSIVIKGDAKLSKAFLYPYLGLKSGSPYCERTMKVVNDKLSELAFINVAQPSGVEFVKNKAYLYIYLNERKNNHFDGYLGLIPVDERSGKVSINGELDLALNNLFRIGEQLNLHWYSSERFSQHLQVSVRFPYLFRSHFGIEGNFQLDKQDTSYLTLRYHLGIPYAFISNNYLSPFFDYTSSTLLNPELLDPASDSISIDYRKSMWGMDVRLRKLDYIFNPRRGFDLSASGSVGLRTIIPNSGVDASLYEGISMKQTSWRLEGNLRGYIPIRNRWVIATRLRSGSLLGGSHYSNEFFRIGGEDGIRGFTTNEITASTFLIYSVECRFLFVKNSYINLFFDGGLYEKLLNSHYLQDWPFGLGAGFHIAVSSGILYVEYALGRQLDNAISFKTGKVHLGIKVSF